MFVLSFWIMAWGGCAPECSVHRGQRYLSPWAGVRGGCESPDTGVATGCSELSVHLSSPQLEQFLGRWLLAMVFLYSFFNWECSIWLLNDNFLWQEILHKGSWCTWWQQPLILTSRRLRQECSVSARPARVTQWGSLEEEQAWVAGVQLLISATNS